jgi:hypothetical protein
MKARWLFALAAVLATAAFALPGHPPEPRRWAVVVGVGDYVNYGDEQGGDLPGAANDARNMRDVLVARWGFRPDGVRMLLDAEATREGIRQALAEWLPSVARPGDLIVFYYSGHGSQVFDRDGDETDGLDETLCPADVMRNSSRLDIKDDELGGWLRALPTRNVTVILDACHSGTATRAVAPFARRKALSRAVTDLTDGPAGAAAAAAPPTAMDGRDDGFGDGVLEISAAQADQYALEASFEGEDGRPQAGGAFTVPLIRYLWQVPAGTSYQEVFRLTRDAVRRGNFAQNPQLSGGAGRPLFDLTAPAAPGGSTEAAPRRALASAAVSGVSADGSVVLENGAAAGMTVGSLVEAGGVRLRVTRIDGTRALARGEGGDVAPLAPGGAPATLSEYAFAEPRLRVTVGGLPEAVLSQLAVLGAVPHVTFLRDPMLPSHLVVRQDGDGFAVTGADGSLRHRVGAASARAAAEGIASIARREQVALMLASLENPAHPFAVDFAFGGDRNLFRIGEAISFRVRAGRDGYLTIVDLDPAGKVTVVYPNAFERGGRVTAGQEVVIPSPDAGFQFTVEEPAGRGVVRAFVTDRPLELDFEQGDLSRAEAVAAALRKALGVTAADGPLPVQGWATASVVYDFTR